MGCDKCNCKLCKKEIKGSGQFELILHKGEHEELKHPEVFEKNKKAQEEFDKSFKEINDKLIYSQEVIFTASKWDGEDYD